MTTGRQPGVPRHISDDTTGVVREMIGQLQTLEAQLEAQAAVAEATLSDIRPPGRLLKAALGLGTVVSVVFSAGVAYSVWLGDNATDVEVQGAIKSHDDDVEAHPPLREGLVKVKKRIGNVEETVEDVRKLQVRLDKRSEYQFEFSRWQADVLEARRRNRKPPPKPPRLRELERDLMLGHY